jgi:hypothetical protein
MTFDDDKHTTLELPSEKNSVLIDIARHQSDKKLALGDCYQNFCQKIHILNSYLLVHRVHRWMTLANAEQA